MNELKEITQDEARAMFRKHIKKHGKPMVMEAFATPWGGANIYMGPPQELYDALQSIWTIDDINWIDAYDNLLKWHESQQAHNAEMKRKYPATMRMQSKIDRKLKRLAYFIRLKNLFGGKKYDKTKSNIRICSRRSK